MSSRFIEQIYSDDLDWQKLCQRLQSAVTLTTLILIAWQIGLYIARMLVEQQLNERTQQITSLGHCSVCRTPLVSKGWSKRRILTLVGWVRWKRRIGRCPRRCSGGLSAPFDHVLGIQPHQQTSTELMRLGCLLAISLPFERAAWLLHQMSGIRVSNDTIWHWVQSFGKQSQIQLEGRIQRAMNGQLPAIETQDMMLEAMPLAIAADGVTVPFRSHPRSPTGKTVWREVKVVILARLGEHQTKSDETVSRLHQKRLVAVLGDIDDLQPRLQLEAVQQGFKTAAQVVWISDGARGFWRLYQDSFADRAVGVLDFYHAVQHLWKAASAYQDGNPARNPQMWFERMRDQLRRGSSKRIVKELDWLVKSKNTSEAAKRSLSQVRDYLNTHQEHMQYPRYRKMGVSIGSGMVESACKWLVQQRFKGTGMRWSEDGFNHLLHLRLDWNNQRFDSLFAEETLALNLYSPNH